MSMSHNIQLDLDIRRLYTMWTSVIHGLVEKLVTPTILVHFEATEWCIAESSTVERQQYLDSE